MSYFSTYSSQKKSVWSFFLITVFNALPDTHGMTDDFISHAMSKSSVKNVFSHFNIRSSER